MRHSLYGPTLRHPEPEPQDDGLLDADPADLTTELRQMWVDRAPDSMVRELCMTLMAQNDALQREIRRRG